MGYVFCTVCKDYEVRASFIDYHILIIFDRWSLRIAPFLGFCSVSFYPEAFQGGGGMTKAQIDITRAH